MSLPGRGLVFAGSVALLAASGATWLVLASNHEPNKVATLAFAVTAGLSFVASGLVALWRRPENRTGYLLVAVGYLWFLGALSESNHDWVLTMGAALGSVVLGAFVHLLLAFPGGRLTSRFDRILVAAAYTLTLFGSIALLLVNKTPNSDCTTCESAIAIVDSRTAFNAIDTTINVLGLVLLVAILFVVARRFLRASAAERRVLGPVLAAGAFTMAVTLVGIAVEAVTNRSPDGLDYVFLAGFGMVPVAFLAGVLRSRLARSSVGDVLLALARGMPIRDALAQVLRDPTLEVAYWLPESGRYVSADGKPVSEESEGRAVTLVEHAGRPTAAILHDPTLSDEPELVQAVAAATGLWLDNERLQAKLRAQIEFLETTVDTSPSLLCSLDRDGRIVNLNLASTRASGHPDQEEVRWETFWDVFVAPEEREGSRSRFESAAPFHEAAAFEHTFVNRKGKELTIAWSTAPLHDSQGNVRNVICGGLDITERRQRELELEVERDFAGTVANTIPIFLVGVWDDATVNDYGPNPAFELQLGWKDEDVTGRSLLDLIHPDDRYLAGMAISSAANGVPAERRESRWLRKEGSTRIVAWSAREILGREGRTVVLVSGLDVTERREQEEEIRASRARIVEAGDEARRRLERNLHDGAQQRLVALALSLRLAQSKVDSDPAGARQVLESAREELTSALDDLRELARGIHPAVLTDRGLGAAIEALATRSPVPVDVETTDERLPRAVEAAAYYVIAESLANVSKYADASEVTVRVTHANGCARIEVADDGVGGADAALGSGLRGLADRLAALEGTLSVDSPLGGGTRVSAEIPLLSTTQE
jgi:PAS domain S-box-containing protein